MFLQFLSSLPSGGVCLIELNHWRFCLVDEIEFLHEFSLPTGTRYWTLRRILSTSLKTVGQTLFFFCRVSLAFEKSQELYFFLWFAILTRFVWNNDFFSKHDWFFVSLPFRSRVSLSFPSYSYLLSCLAFEWKRGWRWPYFDRNLPAFLVIMMLFSRLLVAIYMVKTFLTF